MREQIAQVGWVQGWQMQGALVDMYKDTHVAVMRRIYGTGIATEIQQRWSRHTLVWSVQKCSVCFCAQDGFGSSVSMD